MMALCALFGIMAAGTIIRTPRLGQSLWNDEEYAMRRFSHGAWEQKENRWQFKPVEWSDTLFECKNGNNHHLSSVLVRWSLDAWRFFTGEPREAFSETAARLPALAAGILTLALIAALGVEAGGAWAGVGAAALLAFHPWHVRYAVEAKGYSLMLFFLCVALLGLIRAFRANKTAAWLWFAVGEAGCLLSFAGALYAIAGINLIAGIELLLRKEWRRLGTLAGFNLLAAMPVLVWVLPSVPQIAAYLERPDALRLGMEWDWVRDALSHLAAGVHWHIAEPEIHHGTDWALQSQRSWWFVPVLGWLAPLLTGIGVLVALFRGTAARLAIIGPVIGGAALYAHNAWEDHPAVIWYLLFLLVPLALAAPFAIARLSPMSPRISGPLVLVLFSAYAFATRDVRDRIVSHDRQPMRQAVASVRDSRPEAATAVFGVSNRQTLSYDPRARVMTGEADVDAAVAAANAEGRPLFVYFCGRTESGSRHPDIMKRLDDPSQFKLASKHPGLEAMFSYEVWRHVGKGGKPPSAER